MQKSLIEKVRSISTLNKAWAAIRRNARTSKSPETRDEAAAFEENALENITRIQRQLNKNKFVFMPATGKPIRKRGKKSIRPLVIAPLESRIVQRAVHDVLVTVQNLQPFVRTPYSFGGIKKARDQEISSVPAAIYSALEAIGNGSVYVVRSDISSFFTRIPKSKVLSIIGNVVEDANFNELLRSATDVELQNMAELRQHIHCFPIEDIGVAQGNSLSPLLGNIFLADFDRELNRSPDVRCIRYIDDILILAPRRSTANNHFEKAKVLAKDLGLEFSQSKTDFADAMKGFLFLGIELENGLIRPSKEKRDGLVRSVAELLSESCASLTSINGSNPFDSKYNLINTLLRVRALVLGWGKHYWFCNDFNCIEIMDKETDRLIEAYRASYAQAVNSLDISKRRTLLGIEGLSQMDRSKHFNWPTLGRP